MAASAQVETGDIDVLKQWLSTLPPSDGLNVIYKNVAEHYALENPALAVRWAVMINDPSMLEHSARLTMDLSLSRPDLALQLVEKTRDQKIREYRISLIIEHWAQSDPSQAVAYLSTSSALSDAKRNELLSLITSSTNRQ